MKGPIIKDGAEAVSEAEKTGSYRLAPSQLGFRGWDKKNEVKFEKEPARTSLLQPPPGYQTPSPNAPSGIIEQEKTQATPYDRNSDQGYKK